jgi:hypothetical protein
VYSVGLYVDAPAAKKALHSFRHKPAEELVSNQAMYDGESAPRGLQGMARRGGNGTACSVWKDGIFVNLVQVPSAKPTTAAKWTLLLNVPLVTSLLLLLLLLLLLSALVSSGGVEKTLRLVISFGALKRGQFVSALEERIKPPLKQARVAAPSRAKHIAHKGALGLLHMES